VIEFPKPATSTTPAPHHEMPAPPVRAARYLNLDEREIIQTLEHLRARIGERFPQSGLSRVSDELLTVAGHAAECGAYIRRRNWPVRVAAVIAIVAMLAVLGVLAVAVRGPTGVAGIPEGIQTIEAAINNVVFCRDCDLLPFDHRDSVEATPCAHNHPSASQPRPRRRHAPADQGP